jgi:hypothetical protein
VYTSGALEVEIELPDDASAFYFYAEPNPFSPIAITAVADDGTTSGPVIVDGNAGARYFGFYGVDGKKVAAIVITSPSDFAVGEFGISYDDEPTPTPDLFQRRAQSGGGGVIAGAIALAASQNQRELAAANAAAARPASPSANVTAPRTGDLGPTGPVFIAPPATGEGGLIETSGSNAGLMAVLALVLVSGLTLSLSLARRSR